MVDNNKIQIAINDIIETIVNYSEPNNKDTTHSSRLLHDCDLECGSEFRYKIEKILNNLQKHYKS